jgi:hypothetical protein
MQDAPLFPLNAPLLPLALAAAIFFVFVAWRVRPLVLIRSWNTQRRGVSGALADAKARIAAATDGQTRARALCDAADIVVKRPRGRGSAAAFYLRAMRSNPKSADVVRRAATGLARRPRALEGLLWRYLATVRWNEAPDATAAALDALRALYEGPLRKAVRARAIANAREMVGS